MDISLNATFSAVRLKLVQAVENCQINWPKGSVLEFPLETKLAHDLFTLCNRPIYSWCNGLIHRLIVQRSLEVIQYPYWSLLSEMIDVIGLIHRLSADCSKDLQVIQCHCRSLLSEMIASKHSLFPFTDFNFSSRVLEVPQSKRLVQPW